MSVARDRAEWLRDLYSVGGVAPAATLDVMLQHLGSEIITLRDLPGTLRDLYAEPTVALRRGQGWPWEKWLKAHVIGHRWLHCGNQLDMPRLLIDWQERQAHEFAGYLIWGDPRQSLDWPPYAITTGLLAEEARVPVECVERWWRIVGGVCPG